MLLKHAKFFFYLWHFHDKKVQKILILTLFMSCLVIYYTEKKEEICKDWLRANNLVLWETCVRQVIIGTEYVPHNLKNFKVVKSVKAYRFLLEVLCGLHSPMIGETEIMCQYKALINPDNDHLKYTTIEFSFWNNLLKEAKQVRSRFLQNYGQQSYGGIVYKHAHAYDEISIIGSGSLTASILPHLSKLDKKISIQCRTQAKGEVFQNKYSNIEKVVSIGNKQCSQNTLLVIAAPIETEWLEDYINNNRMDMVIDLRSTQDHTLVNKDITNKYLDLNDVFDDVQAGIKKVNAAAHLAKIEIAKKSLLWLCKTQHRPYGWEDVCVS